MVDYRKDLSETKWTHKSADHLYRDLQSCYWWCKQEITLI